MPEPKTIDNLGLGPSVRWAKDQEFVDTSLIKESPFVSRQTTIDVATPCFSSEFDLLFQTKQRFAPWSFFLSPPGYHSQALRLFTHQTVPSLGSEDFRNSQIKKIKDKVNKTKKARKKPRSLPDEKNWETRRESEEEDRESNALIQFLEQLHQSDEMLAEVNAKRSQYSKG